MEFNGDLIIQIVLGLTTVASLLWGGKLKKATNVIKEGSDVGKVIGELGSLLQKAYADTNLNKSELQDLLNKFGSLKTEWDEFATALKTFKLG